MTAWLRRAGRGTLADGSGVVWSVAEGTRGRRWREIRRSRSGTLVTSLLLEVGTDGRFLHTELATAAGLLTLHPEADGTLHGNVITAAGIRHVAGLAWTPRSVVLVEGSAVCVAAAAHGLRRDVAAAGSAAVDAVTISADLAVAAIPLTVHRPDQSRWQFGSDMVVAVDDLGLPSLADAESWPLEA